MLLHDVIVAETEVLGLVDNHKESQRYLINSHLITIGQLDIFLHFVYDLGECLLDDNGDKLAQHYAAFFFFGNQLIFVQRKNDHASYYTEVLCAQACIVVPVTSIAELRDVPKHEWISNVHNGLLLERHCWRILD